jgi:hypothetical protein
LVTNNWILALFAVSVVEIHASPARTDALNRVLVPISHRRVVRSAGQPKRRAPDIDDYP